MTEQPSHRRVRTRYALNSALCVAGAALAATLIWRDGPTWGIVAALIATALAAVGIHRTATDLAPHPLHILYDMTPAQARAVYSARDHQTGRLMGHLDHTSDPDRRATLYRQRADLVEDMAVVYRLVEPDEQTAGEVQRDFNDEVRLLLAVADAEQSRAAGHPRRPRPWPALEHHAADLLGALADPAVAEPDARARLYLDLARRLISTGVVDGDGAEVLAGISCTYAEVRA